MALATAGVQIRLAKIVKGDSVQILDFRRKRFTVHQLIQNLKANIQPIQN